MAKRENFTVEMIKPLFIKSGMTKDEFALVVGVGTRTVYNWLNSEQPRRISAAVRNNLIKLKRKHMEK